MFSKILLGYDGTREGDNALKISANIAEKFGSKITALNVLPEHMEFTKSFSETDRELFDNWVENNLKKKNIKKLDKKKEQLKSKGIKFSYEINYGVPHKEILNQIKKNDFNLVVLGKGRFAGQSILGGTAKKVLRNSNISALVNSSDFKRSSFKKILVPTDIYNTIKKDLSFAQQLSDKFNSKVYLLNIVEKGDHNYPSEVIQTLKGNSYNALSENLLKAKNLSRVEPRVRVAQNSWIGIKEFINEENIDLVVMMSYGGKKIRSEFLGSVAEKVIEYSPCPVIALSP
ncbi:MAG: universal stress protein [Candidatus Dadabacteria bacterium]|nr:universal stress protein [Candidatus Dadabacteria bacterium]NIS07328.1 universal stress protein [Candidatus Dadabacteria bacterium]NIV41272.1 universal stress protein [Candidatus Dadabacteria bacterium]NIX14507.1 universal stress protein [Candidatus Dadabacteria bacterium]NIY20965.1 universal stress protein [Candidatus Dadabacteria bacterium]